jgi:hypothetical protein
VRHGGSIPKTAKRYLPFDGEDIRLEQHGPKSRRDQYDRFISE